MLINKISSYFQLKIIIITAIFMIQQSQLGELYILVIMVNETKKQLQIKSICFVYLISINAALSSFLTGYSHVFLAQLAKTIQNKNNLSTQQLALTLSLVISATNFGQMSGPFMYNKLTNRYGEAKAMVRCHLVVILSISIQLIQLNFACLMIGRIILGIVIGILSSILPLYLNSISPLSISGKIGSMNQLLTCCGVISAYLFGYLITQDKDDQIIWRILIGFPIVPSALAILGFYSICPYDRIQRHIQKGQVQIVKQYLNSVYKNASYEDIRQQKCNMKQDKKFQYKKELTRYIIAMTVVASIQFCGINGIFYYAKQLFNDITQSNSSLTQQLVFGLSICQLIASLICSKIIDIFGRKYLLLKGQQILIFILFMIFIVDHLKEMIDSHLAHYIIIALIYLHIVVFNFSLGPVGIIYAAQLVPNLIPIIVTLRFNSFLVALSTNYIIHQFGVGQLFLMFGILSSIAQYYLHSRIRETKGKSKPEIYEMYENDYLEKDMQEQHLMSTL